MQSTGSHTGVQKMLKSIHCSDKKNGVKWGQRMVGRSRSTLHVMSSLRHESEMSMSNLFGIQYILVNYSVPWTYGYQKGGVGGGIVREIEVECIHWYIWMDNQQESTV